MAQKLKNQSEVGHKKADEYDQPPIPSSCYATRLSNRLGSNFKIPSGRSPKYWYVKIKNIGGNCTPFTTKYYTYQNGTRKLVHHFLSARKWEFQKISSLRQESTFFNSVVKIRKTISLSRVFSPSKKIHSRLLLISLISALPMPKNYILNPHHPFHGRDVDRGNGSWTSAVFPTFATAIRTLEGLIYKDLRLVWWTEKGLRCLEFSGGHEIQTSFSFPFFSPHFILFSNRENSQ